jgi:putative PIN family toxin of toxin-antitoxin system
VVDTNVVISALFFPDSVPGRALRWVLSHGSLLQSAETVNELHEVLSRSSFDRYVTREEREEFLAALVRESALVDIEETVQACRDPRDDGMLELAVNGRARLLVTGDKDLLTVGSIRGIPIVTPVRLLEIAAEGSGGGGVR